MNRLSELKFCRKGKLVIQSAMRGQCPGGWEHVGNGHSPCLFCLPENSLWSTKEFVLGDGCGVAAGFSVSCYWGVFLCLGRASVAAQGLLPVSRFCNHCLLCWVLKLGEGGSSSVYNSLAQQFSCTGVRFHGFCLCSPGDPICLIWAAVRGCVNLLQWYKRKK